MKDLRYKLRYLAFVWAYLECIGYSGIQYGWGSLVYVLKDEGLYLDLCEGSHNTSLQGTNHTIQTAVSEVIQDDNCDARDRIFNLVFTIGTSLYGVGTFLLGLVSLRFGTRITRITASFLFVAGSLCLATASTDIPWLIFPGLSMVTVGGGGILATNFQISFLFPVWGSAVVSLLSGAYDASAVMQLVIKLGYENGIARSTSYYIMSAVFILTLVNTFVFLPKYFIEKRSELDKDITLSDLDGDAEKTPKTNDTDKTGEQTMQISSRKIISAIFSPELILHTFWLSIGHLIHIHYQATINSVLEDTLDTDEEVSEYTNMYLYFMLCGTVFSFLPGIVYDYNIKFFQNNKSMLRRRLMPSVCPLILASMIAIVLTTFLFFTGPITLFVQFALLVFLRAFLYSFACTYLRQLFPSEYFTTLYGIMFLMAGLFGFLEYALFVWAESQGYQPVNIFLLVATVTTLIHPLYQWRKCWRDGQ